VRRQFNPEERMATADASSAAGIMKRVKMVLA